MIELEPGPVHEISDLSFSVDFYDAIEKGAYSFDAIIRPGVTLDVEHIDEYGRLILEQQ